MAPENANVLLIEDDPSQIEYARNSLRKAGHKVVLEASTKDQALEAVKRIRENSINVTILDGNLSPGDASGADGVDIAKAIREESKGIIIVAFSKSHRDYGDVFVSKREIKAGAVDLGEIVTNL